MSYPTPDDLRTTLRTVLRQTYARLLAPLEGKRAELLTDDEASLLIAPHLGAFNHDLRTLLTVLAVAEAGGAQRVRDALHAGVDDPATNARLDAAVLAASERSRGVP